MNAADILTVTVADAVYRAPVAERPHWPTVDPDVALLPDPTAPTLSRFLPVYRDVLAWTTARHDGSR